MVLELALALVGGGPSEKYVDHYSEHWVRVLSFENWKFELKL